MTIVKPLHHKVVNVMKQHQKKMLNSFLEGDVIDDNLIVLE